MFIDEVIDSQCPRISCRKANIYNLSRMDWSWTQTAYQINTKVKTRPTMSFPKAKGLFKLKAVRSKPVRGELFVIPTFVGGYLSGWWCLFGLVVSITRWRLAHRSVDAPAQRQMSHVGRQQRHAVAHEIERYHHQTNTATPTKCGTIGETLRYQRSQLALWSKAHSFYNLTQCTVFKHRPPNWDTSFLRQNASRWRFALLS